MPQNETKALPAATRWVIVGAGFAGASTARALARAKLGPGVICEQESSYGVHASGRNAGLLRLVERDAVVRALAIRSLRHFEQLDAEGEIVRSTGSLTLGDPENASELAALRATLREAGIRAELLSSREAQTRYPLLEAVVFDAALWCPADGQVDIHALLTRYLHEARDGGFELFTDCRADDLLIEGGRVRGARAGGREIRAEAVVDATGAWAGCLGRATKPLPLRPMRRHIFVTGPLAGWDREWPYVWIHEGVLYFRQEGDGLLLSPCDETPDRPGTPSVDVAASELLAEKLTRYAPGLNDVTLRRSWACLRTFAPDRRPLIGPDPDLPGLYHVSGLGGFGTGTSAAVGELAADLLAGDTPAWIDAAAVAPQRLKR